MRFVWAAALLSGLCLTACRRSGAHADAGEDTGSAGGAGGHGVDGGSAGAGNGGEGGSTGVGGGIGGLGPGGTSGPAGAGGVGPGGASGVAGAGPGGRGGAGGIGPGGRGGAGGGGTSGGGGAAGALACGWKQASGSGGAAGAGVDPSTVCIPWRPKISPWSSPPSVRPGNIAGPWGYVASAIRPSADGQQLYSIAIWLEDGRTRRQIVRSPDLGVSWCLIPTAAGITQVIPAPATPTALYALTTPSSAGTTDVLRSRDGGATWATARGGLPEALSAANASSQSLQVTADPNVVWFPGVNAMHLSRDGVDTWSTVAMPTPSDPTAMVYGPPTIDIAMPRRLLLYGAHPPFSQVPLQPFLITSTDWGVTWTEHNLPTPANPDKLRDYQIGIDQGSTLYVAQDTTTGIFGSFAIWRSTNWAGTWTSMPATGGGVPVTLGAPVAGALYAYGPSGILRSVDAGATWNPLMYPANTNHLFAVTPDKLVVNTLDGIVTTSTDGGATWKDLPIVPTQIDPLIASPVAPYPLWGHGDRLLRSDDGVTWAATAATWPVFPDGASADVAYAIGTGPTALVQTADRGRTWRPLPTPTGGVGTVVATCPPPRSCLYVTQGAVMSRSDDRGQTWRPSTPVTNWGTRSPIVVSPYDPDLLLQGRDGGIYQSRDGGGTWNYFAISSVGVVSLVFMSANDVLAISDQRQLLRSNNGGDDWTMVTPNPMPAGFTRGLVRSITRPGTLFTLTGGPPDAPLYRSDDSGVTWKAQAPLGDGVMDFYGTPYVRDVFDTTCGLMAGLQVFGPIHLE
jgi:hypothetical protein